MTDKPESPNGDTPETVTFHYLKSPTFRTILAHGASVGGTTHGEVVLTPFVERIPIPTQAVHELSDITTVQGEVRQGKVGKQVGQVCREGIIRELDVSLVFPPDVAEQIAKLLLEKAEEARLQARPRTSNKGNR